MHMKRCSLNPKTTLHQEPRVLVLFREQCSITLCCFLDEFVSASEGGGIVHGAAVVL